MQVFRSVGVSSGLIGVAAAVATILVWNLFERPAAARAQVTDAEPALESAKPDTRVVVQRVDGSRLAALEQQVEDLKAARAVEEAETPTDDGVDAEAGSAPFERRISELERRHEDEAADPAWAGRAQQSLVSGLTEMADEHEFSVDTAECKTTTCRASLSWTNYEAARKTGGELAERSFPGLNCVQAVWYQAPTDPAGPYSTQVYFDCTDQRAGLVEAESNE